MQRSSRLVTVSLAMVALAAGSMLDGCGAGEEPSVADAIVHSGLLGGLGEQLKREDDEAEVAELRAAAPVSPEERAEAREAAEAAADGSEGEAEPSSALAEEDEEGSS